MNIIEPLTACGWATEVLPGDDVKRCGATVVEIVELTLPEQPAPGVLIVEGEREVRLGVCGEHRTIAQAVSGPYSLSRSDSMVGRYGPVGELVPADHSAHTSVLLAIGGCIGCDIDFGPAHTREPHG